MKKESSKEKCVTLPQMLTIEQASRETHICASTLRKMCWQGKVKTIRTGKKWLINRNSLSDFLTEGGYVE